MALLFLSPWILGLLGLTLGPMIASLYLSFTDYSLSRGSANWIGLDNYVRLAQDSRWLASVSVTARYVFISVPLQLAISLAVAMAMNRGLRGLAIYRSVYYLPSLLGSSVAIAIIWRQIFSGRGALNNLLISLGWTDPPSWISSPDHALSTLIVLNVWTFGSPMVIFLAGLRQIPAEYYEAATVDGAGKVRQFVSITLPMLSPIVFFNVVMQFINAFQAFTQAFIVSGGSGGPIDATLFYTLYLYQRGFVYFDMGYASAMAWVLLTIIGVGTAVLFGIARRYVHYER